MTFPDVKLIGTGTHLPGKALTIHEVDDVLGRLTNAPKRINKWLERMRGLMDELLDTEYYHFAVSPETGEFTEDNISMAVEASRQAIAQAEIQPEDIDFIAYGSAQQFQMPTGSVRIQEALGIEHCTEISVHANCTSAYKALLTAYDFIRLGRAKTALVVSANMSSSELRADYYHQEIVKKEELFLRYFLSDGAGALILQAREKDSSEAGLFLKNAYTESPGGKKPAGMLNRLPAYCLNPQKVYEKGLHHLAQMFNQQLGEHFHEPGGSIFLNGLKRMLKQYPIDIDKIRFFQVNFPSKHIAEMIIEECETLGIKRDTHYTQIADMGYVGPPMAFISLHKIATEEQMQPGELVLSFVTEVSKFMQAGYTFEYR